MSFTLEFPFPGESKILNDQTRAKLEGSFKELPNGFTHYQLAGQANAPLVVMVHGFSTPSFIWDPTFEGLLAEGFRVLRYDLFGRGTSDRPHGVYDRDRFDQQLHLLLVGLEINEPVSLLGLSMGGIIAANFAVNHPEKVSRLVLIDPAGVVGFQAPRALKIALLPGIGEILLSLVGNRRLEKFILREFYKIEDVSHIIQQIRGQMQFKGYKRALLSTIRAGMLDGAQAIYRQIGDSNLPVLLLWGEEDQVVSFGLSKKLIQMIPQTKLYLIKNSGHIPHYDQPEIVNPILLEFLNK